MKALRVSHPVIDRWTKKMKILQDERDWNDHLARKGEFSEKNKTLSSVLALGVITCLKKLQYFKPKSAILAKK